MTQATVHSSIRTPIARTRTEQSLHRRLSAPAGIARRLRLRHRSVHGGRGVLSRPRWPPHLLLLVIWNRRPPASAAGKLLAGDSHFLDHARVFGELIACHDAKLLV